MQRLGQCSHLLYQLLLTPRGAGSRWRPTLETDMSGYELIPPRRRTVWQKAGEACGMLVIYAILFLLLAKFIGWLL